jgi:hypothetical protein
MISRPMICSAQTMHLSCVGSNTISKWTKTSFHLTSITLEYHQVCPKWFPYPWYIRRKPSTFLAPKLKLFPNRSKSTSARSTSHRSIIRCVQNDLRAYGTYGANRAPILRRDEHYLQNVPKWVSTWSTSRRSTIVCAQNDFQAYGMFSANRAPILRRD